MEHHPLLADVEQFLADTDMPESTFGREAVNDWKFVSELRGKDRSRPRRVWPETEAKIRAFMDGYAAEKAA